MRQSRDYLEREIKNTFQTHEFVKKCIKEKNLRTYYKSNMFLFKTNKYYDQKLFLIEYNKKWFSHPWLQVVMKGSYDTQDV